MHKKELSIVFFAVCACLLGATVVGTLPSIVKPGGIQIDRELMYITEGAKVFVHNLRDLSLAFTFGKEGEGPGEVKALPQYINKLHILPGHLVLESQQKMVWFDRQGHYTDRELKKTSPMILQATPFDDGFVIGTLRFDENRQVMLHVISLCDKEMKTIKDLCRMPFMQQGQPPKARLDMMFDYPETVIYQDRIFVERSHDGFFIDVFDLRGNKVQTITAPCSRRPVTEGYKKKRLEEMKQDTLVSLLGGWNQFRHLYELTFPDVFPPIRSMNLSGEEIYLEIHAGEDENIQYQVINHQGETIKTVRLPILPRYSAIDSLLGARRYTIYRGKLYFLQEDIETEEWILHCQEI